MSLKKFAQERLEKELAGYRPHGLQFWLRHIVSLFDHLEGLEIDNPGFVPSGTRLRRQPAFNPKCGPWDFTLELWDIQGSSPATDDRLRTIQSFAKDLFDLSEVFTELWLCDGYATNRRKVYDVRQDIDGGADMPDSHPNEWFSDGLWK